MWSCFWFWKNIFFPWHIPVFIINKKIIRWLSYSFSLGHNTNRNVLSNIFRASRGTNSLNDASVTWILTAAFLMVKEETLVIGGGGTLKIMLTLVYFELIKSRWPRIIAQGPKVIKSMPLALTLMVEFRVDPFHSLWTLAPRINCL